MSHLFRNRVLSVSIACSAFLLTVSLVLAQELGGVITSYADGDSFRLGQVGIRLDGIDAPESADRCVRAGVPWDCAALAQKALQAIAGSSPLKCISSYCDPYKRRVSICRVGSKDVGEEMVRAGWAIDWPRYSNYRYKAVQDEARRLKRGLWADGVQLPPRLIERMNSAPGRVDSYPCR
ncbi:MAG: thermonuclease family protein [Hyphomicrobiaceae bacterium]